MIKRKHKESTETGNEICRMWSVIYFLFF
jgi:hypothetical protein